MEKMDWLCWGRTVKKCETGKKIQEVGTTGGDPYMSLLFNSKKTLKNRKNKK